MNKKKVITLNNLPGYIDSEVYLPPILNKRSPHNDIETLCKIAKYYTPTTLVEVGTDYGLTTMALSYNLPESNIFTIDNYNPTFINFSEIGKFCKTLHNVSIIIGNSLTIDYSKHINNKPVDLAFIDGSHLYEDVIQDTKNILKHCQQGSVIVWHDYKNPYPTDKVTQAIDNVLQPLINAQIYHIKNTWIAYCVIGKWE